MAIARAGLLAALTLAIVAAASIARADDAGAIRERLNQWRIAFNARDAAGACDLFAPDLEYAVPGIPHGTQETMCGNFVRVFAKPALKLSYAEPAIREIIMSGDVGIVRLTWTLTAEADGNRETTTEEGIDIFRRQPDGRWSIARFVAF